MVKWGGRVEIEIDKMEGEGEREKCWIKERRKEEYKMREDEGPQRKGKKEEREWAGERGKEGMKEWRKE